MPGSVTSSLVAEAWGARLALDLIINHTCAHGVCAESIACGGDNPPVVRYCRGTGRTGNPEIAGVLEQALGKLATVTGPIQWAIIPRRLNKSAHMLARAAALRAHQMSGFDLRPMTVRDCTAVVGPDFEDM